GLAALAVGVDRAHRQAGQLGDLGDRDNADRDDLRRRRRRPLRTALGLVLARAAEDAERDLRARNRQRPLEAGTIALALGRRLDLARAVGRASEDLAVFGVVGRHWTRLFAARTRSRIRAMSSQS